MSVSSLSAQQLPDVLEQKLKWLVKDPSVLEHLVITDSHLIILNDDKKEEFVVPHNFFGNAARLVKEHSTKELLQIYRSRPEPLSAYKSSQPLPQRDFDYSPGQSLSGVRIALDPGHLGGDFQTGQMEDKYVWQIVDNKEIRFTEGDLTLATALFLSESLRNLGAEVLMTRTGWGGSSFGISFDQWFDTKRFAGLDHALKEKIIAKDLYDSLLEEKDRNVWFHLFFKHLDLRNRAEAINAFHPDITLIIHYNVHLSNWMNRNDQGQYSPGTDNYNMIFIPGAFMSGELQEAENRVEFLRLLLTDDLVESYRLSQAVAKKFTRRLAVPLIGKDSKLKYLKEDCINIEKGIYARNLTLTRLVKGPLCYGETFCQDDRHESLNLNKEEILLQGRKVPVRTREVAGAYLQGILDYFGNPPGVID